MKKKKLLLIALLLVGAASSFAAKVDTLLVKSPSMNKDIKEVAVSYTHLDVYKRQERDR